MSPTADSGPTGPRVRARARTSATEGLRPEVAEALGGLERSIGDVAEWEQVLAGSAVDDATDGGAGRAAPTPADLVLLAHVTPGAADAEPPPDDAAGSLDLALQIAPRTGPTAAPEPEPNLDLAPLFAQTGDDPDPSAALVDPVPSPTRRRPEDRRRRNGRILSWMGAIVLVAVAAVWLLPDSGSSDKTVVRDTTTSLETTTTRVGLDGPTFPTLPTTTLPVAATAPITVPATTATTARKATPKPSTTTTTRAPATTTPTTAPPPTTPTTVRATTTTVPVPCTYAPGDDHDHPCYPG